MKHRIRLMPSEDDLMSVNMNGDKNSDDENCNEIQLNRIYSKPQDHYIEAQVQEGDTLQAIALRFYCSISELKRINHIHKDNEIFARRTVKVPVTPYSVLTELVPNQQNLDPVPSTSSSLTQPLVPTIHSVSVNNSHSVDKKENDFAIDCNAVVLNSTIAPSVIPYADIEPAEQASEDTKLLPNREKLSVEAIVVKELTSHGADFGLKWFHLLCCAIVLGVVIPLIYVLFYLDKHEHSDVPPLHGT